MSDPLALHVAELAACRRCPGMVGPPVAPPPVRSRVFLVGQAPGPREASHGRPFAWTAGRQLFRWFATLGVDEETFRSRVYMAAVCRCFPGKASSGGDRVPSRDEIAACSAWMRAELDLLEPTLIVPVGRLAIETILGPLPLLEAVGRPFQRDGRDVIALPHPSGVSTWYKRDPGATRTREALATIGAHPAWTATFGPR
ncbi:MAG: uracil-DNA glycosylase family protein [Myxococcota bacterium]